GKSVFAKNLQFHLFELDLIAVFLLPGLARVKPGNLAAFVAALPVEFVAQAAQFLRQQRGFRRRLSPERPFLCAVSYADSREDGENGQNQQPARASHVLTNIATARLSQSSHTRKRAPV